MSSTKDKGFVYVSDTSADEEFMCPICLEPFEIPMCTPCDHTFCRACIERWLEQNEELCPTCRASVSLNRLIPASRIISNRIDRYLVKCLACDQTGIQRGQFNDHLLKVCIKVDVPCPRADIKCPWKGPKDGLSTHLSTCIYDQMLPLLTDLLTSNASLTAENSKNQNKIELLTAELGNMRKEIVDLSNELKRSRELKVPRRRIINFETLGNGQTGQWYSMPEIYENFQWVKCWYMTKAGAAKHFSNTGFVNAFTHNLSCVALNHIGHPLVMRVVTQGETFCLHSFEATSACYDKMKLHVVGQRNGHQVYTKTVTLEFDISNVFELNWNDIDELSLRPNGGTLHPGCPDWRYVTVTYLSIS